MVYFAQPDHSCFDDLTVLDFYERYTVTPPKNLAPALSVAPPGKFSDYYSNIVSRRRDNSLHDVCRVAFQIAAVGDLFYLRLFSTKFLMAVHFNKCEPFQVHTTIPT